MKDLPTAVRKTIQENLKGAQVTGIGKEVEKGVTQYEVETLLNGKHRDLEVDTKGTLLVVEEETSIDEIPAAAKTAIMKKVGSGKLGMVETANKADTKLYEAGCRRPIFYAYAPASHAAPAGSFLYPPGLPSTARRAGMPQSRSFPAS